MLLSDVPHKILKEVFADPKQFLMYNIARVSDCQIQDVIGSVNAINYIITYFIFKNFVSIPTPPSVRA